MSSYLVDRTGITIEQHAERILENYPCVVLSKRVLSTFNGFAQERLSNISAVASCESRRRVGDAEQVHIS